MRFFPRLFSWRPLRFLISGGMAAVVNLSTLFILVDVAGVWYLPATAVAYAAAIGVSFVMQKFFTFGDYGTEDIGRQSLFYTLFQISNIAVNTVLVYAGVEFLRIPYLLAQILSGVAIAFYTFAVLEKFLFGNKRAVSPSTCPACGIAAQAEWGSKNGCRLVRCADCGVIFMDPMPSDTREIYGDGYFSGDSDFGYVEYERDKEPMRRTYETYLEMMEKMLGRKGRLFDFGCATGFFMKIAQERGWEVEGADISEHASALGRAKGLTIYTGAMLPASLPEKSFDAVALFDVIEHVRDPQSVIAECARLLKVGGILAVTTPDSGTLWARLMGPRWHLVVPPEHLVLFNRRNFADLLASFGLREHIVTTIGKHFTLPYIFQTLYRWQGFFLWSWLARLTNKGMLSKTHIPINLRDNFFMIASKT